MHKPPPQNTILTCLALLLGLLIPVNSMAMRCGSMLVNKGNSQAKVLKYCGDPVQRNERFGLRTGFYAGTRLQLNGSSATESGSRHYYSYGRSEVFVEEWVFNRGPNQLMRVVTFEDGFVVDVDTLGYGYHE
jgi:hypothetical protein